MNMLEAQNTLVFIINPPVLTCTKMVASNVTIHLEFDYDRSTRSTKNMCKA